MRSRGDVWRESAVLLVTCISFLGLIGAGAFFWRNGGPAGEAALAQLSGEVANAVALEWGHLRREGAWLEGDLQVWTVEPGPPPVAAHNWPEEQENLVVEALLSEAERLRSSVGDSEGALGILLDLLEKSPTPRQLASVRLQIIQLAAQFDRQPLVRETLALVRSELRGAEDREGVSLLMLSCLAAAPALTDDERAALRQDLVNLWHTAQLALPAQNLNGNSLRGAFAQAVQDLVATGATDPRLKRAEQAEHSRLLAEVMGKPLPGPQGSALMVQSLNESELLYRRHGPGLAEGRLFPVGTCAEALAERVHSSRVLPDGFHLDLVGDDSMPGTLIRDWTALEHLPRGFRLLHDDPSEFTAVVEGRQRLLSSGFFALALGLLVAGLVLFRSIRRERNLARLKSLFIANVSHELRTPVASILLMAENLESGRVEDPESRLRYHRLIRREADRLRRLVNDVLDFSRIERGKSLQMMVVDLDLQAFAQELEAEARERVCAKGGELEFEVDANLTTLAADGDALRRACMNLVENALRHSGQLNVAIRLSTDGAQGLLMRVVDCGTGVPSARLEALFEPFERVEGADENQPVAAGTGLGLAIVREIAESHGGQVTAQNTEPTGFAVEIRVPGEPKEESQS